jgi:hypothetical protein
MTSREVILGLLVKDLAARHRHLALRHYLMLCACNSAIPGEIAEQCSKLLSICEPRRLARISNEVRHWHELTIGVPINAAGRVHQARQ